MDNGYALYTTRASLWTDWKTKRWLPLYIAAVIVWLPTWLVVYALPLALQFPFLWPGFGYNNGQMSEKEEIELLWQTFRDRPFPHGSRTKDLTVDLAFVDGTIAGCARTFVEDGALSSEHIKALRRCIGGLLDLRARCSKDDAAQKAYIAQLLTLSEKVLQAAEI